MRILIDTNVLISALIFPGGAPSKAIFHATVFHDVVLCDENLSELRAVVTAKWPDRLPDLDVFIAEFAYDLIPSVHNAEKLIRDATDQPILNAAILANVDIIISGDKDFLCLDIETPTCMSPADFLARYAAGDASE